MKWVRRKGITITHWIPEANQIPGRKWESACGIVHSVAYLMDETSTKHRCTTCTRIYEREMGLFA